MINYLWKLGKKILKKPINRIFIKHFNVKLYSIRAHGREDWFDIKKTKINVATIFDVGANIGQSAKKFKDAFPKAMIYSFEPVSGLYEKLMRNTENDLKVNCFPIALGDRRGFAEIYLTEHSTTSSLVRPENNLGSEKIQVNTIDEFSAENKVSTIDILKIDVEGYDLEVLKGANIMLSKGRVLFILVEVGFDPRDSRHTLFDDVRSYLIERGYVLYGIYDQQLEWTGENSLRFANVCFCRKPLNLKTISQKSPHN